MSFVNFNQDLFKITDGKCETALSIFNGESREVSCIYKHEKVVLSMQNKATIQYPCE